MRKVSAWVATHAPAGTRWGKRTLSLLLSFVLCLSLLPGAAFAADSGSHVHNWSYTASGDTITAACTADGCPTPSGSVTISAPDNLTYDGKEKAAKLNWTNWADSDKNAVKISYKIKNGDNWENLGGTPTDAGTYTASITLGNATASVEYTIAKADPPHITALPLTMLWTDAQDDREPWSQTVTWSGIPEDAKPISYTVSGTVIVPSNNISFTTCVISDNKVLTYDFGGATKANVGQMITIPVEIVMENYENATVNVEIKLSDRKEQGEFVFEENTLTKAYGDEDFTFAATGNVEGSTVTYESKNPAVATVDDTGKVHIKGLGTAEIHATATETEEYEAKTILYKLTVTKRQLTVKYDDQAITVGDAFPEITISYGNFAPGDSKEDVIASGPSSYVLTDSNGHPVSADTARSTAGTYTITNNGAVTLKDGMEETYEVPTVQSGTLTVSARPSSGIYVPTYSATVDETEHGSASVSPKNAKQGTTVTITVTPDKGYTLETLTVTDKNGKEVKLTEKNGKYTFTMPASSVTVAATFMDDNTMLNFFVDVKASDYYYDAVLWAAQKGITSGTDAVHFSPNQPCTRAQIVTFLWRAAGSPEPKNVSSFADVSASSYYAKAVAWAVENGIATGTTATTFGPNSECTRAQAVTFLARALNAKASGKAAFSDVPTSSYYADAVVWAVENGVTNGIADTLFGPDNSCTRGQIVTFLWRAYSK